MKEEASGLLFVKLKEDYSQIYNFPGVTPVLALHH